MVKITLIKFNNNLAVSIGGTKRQNFKKGNIIAVGKEDVKTLLRLQCSVIGEFELNYKKHKKFIDKEIGIDEKKEAQK